MMQHFNQKNECVIGLVKICTLLRYSICKALGTETTENWYSHVPSLHVNRKIYQDHEIKEKKKQIRVNRLKRIKSKRDKIFILINLAIPSIRNVLQKENERKLKYKDKH
jgi:hypothetical protein